MKIHVPDGLARTAAISVLKAKKNSPHIFFAAGVVGAVGSAVLACKATLKLEAVLDEVHADVERVKNTDVEIEGVKISDQERNRVLAVKYSRGALKVAKLYAPAAVLGAASVGLLTGSHIQLVRRNSTVTAALAMASKAFDDYRGRIREAIGEEKELDVYRGISTEIQEIDGKQTKVQVIDKDGRSPWARIFDESSIFWKRNAELNLMFLRCQQEYLNHKLQVNGVVLLNDAYEALGFDRTRQGAIMGWTKHDRNGNGAGAGFIDFGIYDLGNGRFVNGMEHSVLLDFNVNPGTVYQEI